jgi:membrane protease YdiL (CAAX protease family)
MKKRDLIARVGALLASLAFLAVWVLNPSLSDDPAAAEMWRSVIYRGIAGMVFVFALLYLEYRVLSGFRLSHLAVLLPALLVAANNFPILGMINGTLWLDRSDLLWLYVLDCLMIGLFEELAFRGVLLPFLLEKRRGSKSQVLWTVVLSSGVFGLIHLINLFEGAGVGSTLLQVGYSFLIGGMCAIVLMKTGNLLYCILLHTVYDIGGRWMTVAGGELWDTPTVILTVILALIVVAWMLVIFFRMDEQDAERFYR